ncbi:hypothetical protein C1H46_045871 [Malus baccata]|uniref:Uncharacterized protein n=1 Tax=Malus baccata TaxID=106549 RepID=A0A540K2U3_MALBA|nr:hypothetical protein C1H46_045871 [Malus baccata]
MQEQSCRSDSERYVKVFAFHDRRTAELKILWRNLLRLPLGMCSHTRTNSLPS